MSVPIEVHTCFDQQATEDARLAQENKSWVPGIIQEAYHSLMDKRPVYPKGSDACGPMPSARITKEWEIKHTDVFSNTDSDQMTLKLSGVPKEFHIKGSLRFDILESKVGWLVTLPGEIKPGVRKMERTWATNALLTFKSTDDEVISTPTLGGWTLEAKKKP